MSSYCRWRQTCKARGARAGHLVTALLAGMHIVDVTLTPEHDAC
ncbi:hypothetical protein ACFWMU_27875 [Streptomyces sp. NPDC058357]